jgi:hypothetical protein
MAYLFDIAHALSSLHPSSNWYIDGEADNYDNLVWEDDSITKPTLEQVNAERQRLTDEYNNAEYKRNRASAYPAISDQLDMLYHAIDSDETLKTQFADFYTAIKQVKDNNPKS